MTNVRDPEPDGWTPVNKTTACRGTTLPYRITQFGIAMDVGELLSFKVSSEKVHQEICRLNTRDGHH